MMRKRYMMLLVMLTLVSSLFCFTVSVGEELSYQIGGDSDIMVGMNISPSVVTEPQSVKVSIFIRNMTSRTVEVQLYSPSAEKIGNPHSVEPDQTVFIGSRYDVNQKTIDNGNIVYFVKYAIPNESGRDVEQSQPIRYQLNGNSRNRSSLPLATPQPTSEWPVLTAKEVMYNYANSYKKDFYLKGVGELRNYYNYAYDKCEKDYFCMQVRPSDSYFDSWYIYFHRDSFQELYNYAVQNGKVTLEMRCSITRYEENQRDMAEAFRVRWWK